MMVRFTTKKIESLTLGERLKKMRNDRRLGINDISKSTRIQVKYLQYLEDGDYSKLPADVYVKGFLRSYAAYMGISEKTLIKQYEREQGIQKSIAAPTVKEEKKKKNNPSSFVITPKIIIASSIALVLFLGFFYLYREVDDFISVPRLVILKPSDGNVINSSVTHVTGVAEKDAVVSINDQMVMVNEKGEFGEDVVLQKGVNTITVKAKNKFEKESVKSIVVNAEFEAPEISQSQKDGNLDLQSSEIHNLKLEVSVRPNPTWLSVIADGNLVYSGVLSPGDMQLFEANEKIAITSAKGNETFVKFNGKDEEVLGGVGAVDEIVFTAEGREKTEEKVVEKKEERKKKN